MTASTSDKAAHADGVGARRSNAFAALGALGAMLASSCCVAPLVLAALGVSGAWIGALTALEPLKPYFLAATAILLGVGFWRAYTPPRTACEDGTLCAAPRTRRLTKLVLWVSAALALSAASVQLWAPIFY